MPCPLLLLPRAPLQACNYTTVSYCPTYQPSPSSPAPPTGGGVYSPSYPPEDPCAYSQDPCCRRSTSFSTCVLESPPEEACSFYGSCATDYGICSRQVGAAAQGWTGGTAGCQWVLPALLAAHSHMLCWPLCSTTKTPAAQ